MPDRQKTISVRINEIFLNSGLTQEKFSKEIEIDRGQFGKILRGELNATLMQLITISQKFEVRLGWLVEGELPIKKSGMAPDEFSEILKEEIQRMHISLQRLAKGLALPYDPGTNEIGAEGFQPVLGKKAKTGKS